MSNNAEPTTFSDVLQHFVSQSGYTAGQLARLTAIPKQTIISWLDGRVRRPRSASDLLGLSRALHLTPEETAQLLTAAGHGTQAATYHAPIGSKNAPGAPFQAIPEPAHFVGRESLLAELETAVRSHQPPGIFVLHGMGGVGKTAVAARLAYRLRADFPDGVLWAQVGHNLPGAILNAFSHAFGEDLTVFPQVETRSQMLRQLLADHRVFMILDDVHSGSDVEPLLPPSTGKNTVLITTRRRDLFLNSGLNLFEVPLFDAARGEGLRLFERFLGRERCIRERDDLLAVAAQVGHLPLAVALAATRLAQEPDWTAATFRQRLADVDNRLVALAVDNRSVQASLHVSVDALPPPLVAVFHSLAVFGIRPFHAEVVAYLNEISVTQAQEHLRRLFAFNLIESARQNTAVAFRYYRLHPLTSDFARLQLPTQQQTDLYRHLRDYYIHYAERHHHQPHMLAWEAANITAALTVAHEHGLPPATLPQPLRTALMAAGVSIPASS